MAEDTVAQLRTVLRLRQDCTFEVTLRDRESDRAAVLSCPGGVAIELHGPGVVDRLAAAVIEAAELLGVRPGLTGARAEELRALRWEHVHLDGYPNSVPTAPPFIEVWRSVREGGETKTRKSRRTLALPARCVEALKKQRVQQVSDQLAAGERWQESGLVFTTKLGTAMDAANVRRDFGRALGLVGSVDPMDWTPRELRHSFVSLLSDAGVPLEEISRLVGHSGTWVTELVYRHQLRPAIQTGATVMDALFAEKDRNGRGA